VTPPPLGTPSSAVSSLPGDPGDGGAVVTSSSDGRVDATPRPPVPSPAAGVELFGETPGSGYREPPSLARRSDGQTIQLTPLLYEVLRAIDGTRDYHQVAAVVSERIGRTASAADVLFLAEAKLRPLGLLRGHDGSEPELQKANPLLALSCKFVISNPDLTRRITRPFAALFRPSIVLFVFAAFLYATWWAFFEQGIAPSIHQAFYEPHLLLLVFALTLVSAGFHEFGHAAACRYGGATPGAMGFGLYLIWPAFYTDVTDSYRLGRGGRLRVDLGGLYFNMVFAVATFAVWSWLRADALLLLIVAQVLQMSRQLAPLVRFDGYHILADLTGVPDLFAHIKPTLLGLLPSRWRGGQHQALKPWARIVVTLWVLVVVPLLLVMLAMIVMILPRLAATAWDSLGVQWEVLGRNWAEGDFANVGIRVLSMISLALPVLMVSYLLGRVGRRMATKLWRATDGSTANRVMAGVGVAAILAAVALAWWQQGQFTPIEADEEGTFADLFDFGGLPGPELVRAETVAPQAGGAAAFATTQTTHPLQLVGAARTVGPPRLGFVLVPADQPAGEATAWLVDPEAGTQDVPAVGDQQPGGGEDWPFPWYAPPPTAEGDNRAMVVNTEDGSTAYDVALAFVWVTDGGPVDERNEAFAYASCTDCTSVAVAFQTIFIIGHADVITPVNTAVAANYACTSCTTHALAVQLVVTLIEEPSEEVLSELGRVWAELEQLEANIGSLTLEQIYHWLKHAELQILTILMNAGGTVEESSQETATDLDDGEVGDVEDDTASTVDDAAETGAQDALADPEGGSDPTSESGGVDDATVTGETTDPDAPEPTEDADAVDDTDPATTDDSAAEDTATEPEDTTVPEEDGTSTDDGSDL
jgi:putative peptide zinc metalloprotease protein